MKDSKRMQPGYNTTKYYRENETSNFSQSTLSLTLFERPEFTYAINNHMVRRLHDLERRKIDAILDIPAKLIPLITILRMPQVVKSLKILSRVYIIRHLEYGYRSWWDFCCKVRLVEDTRRLYSRSVLLLQCVFRRFLAMCKADRQRKIRSQTIASIKIQSRYRAHRERVSFQSILFLHKSKVLLKHHSRCIIIQKYFRGFLCRANFSNLNRSTLHRELNDWANGPVLKLFDKLCNRNQESREFIRDAIDLALRPSRPLYLTTPWRILNNCRKDVFARRIAEEGSADELHQEYTMRLHERSIMRKEDQRAQFFRDYSRLLREIRERKLIEERQRMKREVREREKIIQMRMARRIQAVQNSQKLREKKERAAMFLEDFKQQRARNISNQSVTKRLDVETELLRVEDCLSRLSQEYYAQRVAAEQVRRHELLLICQAKLVGDSVWGEGGKTCGSTIAERRARSRVITGQLTIDSSARRAVDVADSYLSSEVLNIVKGVRRDIKHWWRYQDTYFISENAAFLQGDYFPDSCWVMKAKSMPVYITSSNHIVEHRLPSEDSVNDHRQPASFAVDVGLDDTVSSSIILLNELRDVEKKRFLIYSRLSMAVAAFRKCHHDLKSVRKSILRDKFPTRLQRRNAIEKAVELQHVMHAYKGIIAIASSSLAQLEREVIQMFSVLFRLNVREEVHINEGYNMRNQTQSITHSNDAEGNLSIRLNNRTNSSSGRPFVSTTWVFDTLSPHPYSMTSATKRCLSELLAFDMPPILHDDYQADFASLPAKIDFSEFDCESSLALPYIFAGVTTLMWSSRIQAWLGHRGKEWKEKYRRTHISHLQRFLWLIKEGGWVSTDQIFIPRLVSKSSAFDLLELLLCHTKINIQVNLKERAAPIALTISSDDAERLLGRHPASALARFLALRDLRRHCRAHGDSSDVCSPNLLENDRLTATGAKSKSSPEKSPETLSRLVVRSTSKARTPSRRVLNAIMLGCTTTTPSRITITHDSIQQNNHKGRDIQKVNSTKSMSLSPSSLGQTSKHLNHTDSFTRKSSLKAKSFDRSKITFPSQNSSVIVRRTPGRRKSTSAAHLLTVSETSTDLNEKKREPFEDYLESIITKSSIDVAQQVSAEKLRTALKKVLTDLECICNDRVDHEKQSDLSILLSSPACLTAAVVRECLEIENLIKAMLTNNALRVHKVASVVNGDAITLEMNDVSIPKFLRSCVSLTEWVVSIPSWMHPVFHWGSPAPAALPNRTKKRVHKINKSIDDVVNRFLVLEKVVDNCAVKLRSCLFDRVNKIRKVHRKRWSKAEQSHMHWEDARSQALEELERRLQARKNTMKRPLIIPSMSGRIDARVAAEDSLQIATKLKSKSKLKAAIEVLRTRPTIWPMPAAVLTDLVVGGGRAAAGDQGQRSVCWTTGQSVDSSLQALRDQLEKQRRRAREAKYVPPREYSVNVPELWVAGGSTHSVIIARAITDGSMCSRGRPMVEIFSGIEGECNRLASLRCGTVDRQLCENDSSGFSVRRTSNGRLLCDACHIAIGETGSTVELPTVDDIVNEALTEFFSARYALSRGRGPLSQFQRKIREKIAIKPTNAERALTYGTGCSSRRESVVQYDQNRICLN